MNRTVFVAIAVLRGINWLFRDLHRSLYCGETKYAELYEHNFIHASYTWPVCCGWGYVSPTIIIIKQGINTYLAQQYKEPLPLIMPDLRSSGELTTATAIGNKYLFRITRA